MIFRTYHWIFVNLSVFILSFSLFLPPLSLSLSLSLSLRSNIFTRVKRVKVRGEITVFRSTFKFDNFYFKHCVKANRVNLCPFAYFKHHRVLCTTLYPLMWILVILNLNGFKLEVHKWLIGCILISWEIFHSYPDITIVSYGLQNLCFLLVLLAVEQRGIFILPHLLWHRPELSYNEPTYLVDFYDN